MTTDRTSPPFPVNVVRLSMDIMESIIYVAEGRALGSIHSCSTNIVTYAQWVVIHTKH